MRTTLKRGVGRAAGANGNGNEAASLPPATLADVALYKQPPGRTGKRLAVQILGWSAFVVSMVAVGLAGGGYLWAHESVAAVSAHTESVKQAAEKLDVPQANQPATALVIGYDRRKSDGKNAPSRSDTLMLVRADPAAKTISLLSLPRDLSVPIVCPGRQTFTSKINSAYAYCGETGSLQTVRNFTHIPINYLITVNSVASVSSSTGSAACGWTSTGAISTTGAARTATRRSISSPATSGSAACARSTSCASGHRLDLYRNARQQEFVRAMKDQIQSNFPLLKLPQVVNVITKNVEVGQGGGKDVAPKTVLSYALLAYKLPPGHVFQARFDGLEGFGDLHDVQRQRPAGGGGVHEPGRRGAQEGDGVGARGESEAEGSGAERDDGDRAQRQRGHGIRLERQLPSLATRVQDGAAAERDSGQCAVVRLLPHRRVLRHASDRRQARGGEAAGLFGSADVKKMTVPIRQLANGAMIASVVGQTFHGRLAPAPIDKTPTRQAPNVVPGTGASLDLLREAQRGTPFPLMVPTVIERSSWIDSERPIRAYFFDQKKGRNKTVRLTYKLGGRNEYWGVQQAEWDDAPVLGGKSTVRMIKGRRYELHYNGANLHMIVLRTERGSYWVVNSLLDRLSNETMLAIAKGLKPIASMNR